MLTTRPLQRLSFTKEKNSRKPMKRGGQSSIPKLFTSLKKLTQKYSQQTDLMDIGHQLVKSYFVKKLLLFIFALKRKGLSIIMCFTGKHNYLTLVIHLDDYCERGTAWKTWENLVFLDASLPTEDFEDEMTWADFQGSWGNMQTLVISFTKS
jgi:hypothetical protein